MVRWRFEPVLSAPYPSLANVSSLVLHRVAGGAAPRCPSPRSFFRMGRPVNRNLHRILVGGFRSLPISSRACTRFSHTPSSPLLKYWISGPRRSRRLPCTVPPRSRLNGLVALRRLSTTFKSPQRHIRHRLASSGSFPACMWPYSTASRCV